MTDEVGNSDYEEFIEATLEVSKEFVETEFRNQHGEKTEEEIQLFLQDQGVVSKLTERALAHALRLTGRSYRDVTRTCIELIYRCDVNKSWQFADQEFASLLDWANSNLNPYMSEDYIARFVNASERMLSDVDRLGARDSDGAVITGLDVIRNASVQQIKENSFAYTKASDNDKRELVKLIHGHAPINKVKEKQADIFKKLQNAADDPDETPDDPDDALAPEQIQYAFRPKLKLELTSVDGGWVASIPEPLTERDLQWLKGLLGDQFETSFATPKVNLHVV